MLKIFIWGTGKLSSKVYSAVRKDIARVIGFIDSQEEKQGKEYADGIKIYAPDFLQKAEYDYLIISVANDREILKMCGCLEVGRDKIISYWNEDWEHLFLESNYKIIRELENQLRLYQLRLENAPYEYGKETGPVIRPGNELLEKIIDEKCSLCRFGDGELELLRGVPRGWFQDPDVKLQERLKEVFYSDKSNVCIALADNFGNLDKYTESAADDIRAYLCGGTRNDIMQTINTEKEYWDTYVTRPYIIYRDKRNAEKIFELFKCVWRKRKVIIVEGAYSRLGIGNDLFEGAQSIRRIICPHQNAFSHYDEIIAAIKRIASREDLILLSLGQTATVLAYDLADEGFQALDIGQIDNEYEWFLMGAEKREEIQGKSVAEIVGWHTPEQERSELYESQIVWRWNEV